ncbi:MAG: pyridoxal phosphate-dependent aminotransferase, partial [Pseudomonadota bacterium]
DGVIYDDTQCHDESDQCDDADAVAKICAFAQAHDLWIISDEVYEEMVYASTCASPWGCRDARERIIVISSISKSFAAPGLRSGWMLAVPEVSQKLLLMGETILFGNQPFLADATAKALASPRPWPADAMAKRFAKRAQFIAGYCKEHGKIHPIMPKAGMFMLLDIRDLGVSAEDFAWALLEQYKIAVMPGTAFGEQAKGLLRVALSAQDDAIMHAMTHIRKLADSFC